MVPKLTYNLLSVSKILMQGNTSPSVTTSVLYTMRRRTSGCCYRVGKPLLLEVPSVINRLMLSGNNNLGPK